MVATGAAILLTTRVLGGASQLAQMWFDAAVLEKYRSAGGRVMRTDSMGRLKVASWSVDFGIANDALIHLSSGEAQARIPAGERVHWATHTAVPALSTNYVSVQISHGTCVDDGDFRDW